MPFHLGPDRSQHQTLGLAGHHHPVSRGDGGRRIVVTLAVSGTDGQQGLAILAAADQPLEQVGRLDLLDVAGLQRIRIVLVGIFPIGGGGDEVALGTDQEDFHPCRFGRFPQASFDVGQGKIDAGHAAELAIDHDGEHLFGDHFSLIDIRFGDLRRGLARLFELFPDAVVVGVGLHIDQLFQFDRPPAIGDDKPVGNKAPLGVHGGGGQLAQRFRILAIRIWFVAEVCAGNPLEPF